MFIFIDKPEGYTSADIVRKMKKLYPGEKIGHGGTLDPMATGLLIIGVGKNATKRLGEFQKYPKEYITTIDFSLQTDTWDKDYYIFYRKYEVVEQEGKKGLILNNKKVVLAPTLNQIDKMLKQIKGEAKLPIPFFSAKRFRGKRLYELARDGKKFNLFKTMMIYDYKILDYNFPCLKLWLKVGGGTYVRSIGYYLGKQFGLYGTLTELKRIAIGPYTIYKLFK